MELSLLYFMGLPVKISVKRYISVHEDCFSFSSVYRDEMLPFAFHLGLHGLPKYLMESSIGLQISGRGRIIIKICSVVVNSLLIVAL